MLASSRKPCHTANPRRRAKSPALHCGRERAAADERLLSVKPAGGPMKSSAPTQGRAAACYPRRCCPPAYIVGRAFTPVGKACVGRKDIGRAGRRTPPPPAAAPPLAGEALRVTAVWKGSPARGAGCAARRRLRGALPPYGGDILQNVPETCPTSVGDDACIVPQTLPYRKPQAAGEIARPTLWPGTGGGR